MSRFEPGEAAAAPESASDVRGTDLMAACRYEERECWRCLGGRVQEAAGPAEGPRFVPCPDCGGTRRVSVYLYPKPRGRRRRGRS